MHLCTCLPPLASCARHFIRGKLSQTGLQTPQLQAVVDIFLGYGFTWPNVHAVLLGYAPVLRVE